MCRPYSEHGPRGPASLGRDSRRHCLVPTSSAPLADTGFLVAHLVARHYASVQPRRIRAHLPAPLCCPVRADGLNRERSSSVARIRVLVAACGPPLPLLRTFIFVLLQLRVIRVLITRVRTNRAIRPHHDGAVVFVYEARTIRALQSKHGKETPAYLTRRFFSRCGNRDGPIDRFGGGLFCRAFWQEWSFRPT
jgi:hypothetical protein